MKKVTQMTNDVALRVPPHGLWIIQCIPPVKIGRTMLGAGDEGSRTP